MAETKHTPGPWQLHAGTGLDLVAGPDGVPVMANDRPSLELLANARLIMAAPELLEALRFVLAHAFEAKWSGDERALHLVEAAIDKAEGRAP